MKNNLNIPETTTLLKDKHIPKELLDIYKRIITDNTELPFNNLINITFYMIEIIQKYNEVCTKLDKHIKTHDETILVANELIILGHELHDKKITIEEMHSKYLKMMNEKNYNKTFNETTNFLKTQISLYQIKLDEIAKLLSENLKNININMLYNIEIRNEHYKMLDEIYEKVHKPTFSKEKFKKIIESQIMFIINFYNYTYKKAVQISTKYLDLDLETIENDEYKCFAHIYNKIGFSNLNYSNNIFGTEDEEIEFTIACYKILPKIMNEQKLSTEEINYFKNDYYSGIYIDESYDFESITSNLVNNYIKNNPKKYYRNH